MALQTLACLPVNDVTIYFTVSIDHAVLTRKVLVLGMDVEGVGLLLFGVQFAAEIFVVHPKPELIGVGGIVSDAVVDVVVGYAGACSERNLTAEIGKQIQSVVVVVLCNGQLTMQYKPVNQV